MGSKHTPGPFMVQLARRKDVGGARHRIMGPGNVEVASVPAMEMHCPNADADADLFAAAPELLEALRALLDRIDPGVKGRDLTLTSLVRAMEAARAAIAKAEGR